MTATFIPVEPVGPNSITARLTEVRAICDRGTAAVVTLLEALGAAHVRHRGRFDRERARSSRRFRFFLDGRLRGLTVDSATLYAMGRG